MTAKARAEIKKMQRILDPKNLAKVAYPYFKSITPIKSGNARRHTSLNGDQIDTTYPYAKRLDTGWSRQAPKGMTDPTWDYILKYIKKQLGK